MCNKKRMEESIMKWIKEVFGTEKPIVAMCHLQAMPGDPYYDKALHERCSG